MPVLECEVEVFESVLQNNHDLGTGGAAGGTFEKVYREDVCVW